VEWQFETKAATDDLFLSERTERSDDSDVGAEAFAGGGGEVAEEFGRGIRERIVAEGADGDGVDLAERAEYGSFREQHQVAAGKVDGFVGSSRAGHAPASRAPMRTVEISRGQMEDGQWLVASAGNPKIAAE